MSVRTHDGLARPIGVGTLVGLAVLAIQPASPLPSVRVGAAPLVASALGTVGAIVYLLARESASERFARTWAALSEEVDQ